MAEQDPFKINIDLERYTCKRCGNKDDDSILIVSEGNKETSVYCSKCGAISKIE